MDMTADNRQRQESVEITRDLLIRYDRPGPRYTSYPTVPAWKQPFGDS